MSNLLFKKRNDNSKNTFSAKSTIGLQNIYVCKLFDECKMWIRWTTINHPKFHSISTSFIYTRASIYKSQFIYKSTKHFLTCIILLKFCSLEDGVVTRILCYYFTVLTLLRSNWSVWIGWINNTVYIFTVIFFSNLSHRPDWNGFKGRFCPIFLSPLNYFVYCFFNCIFVAFMIVMQYFLQCNIVPILLQMAQ